MPIIFITGNINKAEDLKRQLDYPVIHQKVELLEIQSVDINDIVTHKVKEAYKKLKHPVLVEDTSLSFKALGKLPGTLIKWFLKEMGNEGLCKILDSYNTREAEAISLFAYYDGNILKFFEGRKIGTISKEPRGALGFGWDAIFIPEGSKKTQAEMSDKEQKETSMRGIAVKKLKRFLAKKESI